MIYVMIFYTKNCKKKDLCCELHLIKNINVIHKYSIYSIVK